MSANGTKKPRLKARVVGPAAPADVLDKMDAEEREEYGAWMNMRQTVVSIGKRMGLVAPGPARKSHEGERSAPSTGLDEDAGRKFAMTDFVDDVIEPPFEFSTLCMIMENSSALRQNIEAMVTNVDGFGHRFEPVLDFTNPEINNRIRDILLRKKLDETEDVPDDLLEVDLARIESLSPSVEDVEATKKLWERVAAIEKGRIDSFFSFVNPVSESFIELRKETREERELFGNAGWETIREDPGNVDSKINQIYRVPFGGMRLIRADRKATKVEMMIKRDEVHFDTVVVHRFFRRYVRETPAGRTYYKQFGDPRVVSRTTGKYYETIEELQSAESRDGVEALPANEFFHWKVRSSISPYGIPRWISALLSVLGSRAAEEVNFLYFDNKAIPPMVLLVSGGRVSEDSVEKLETYIEERIKGRENFHKILILEGLPADAEVSEGEIEHSGKMRLELKPLLSDMQNDALFQNYDGKNVEKIGRVFRQPQIMTGDTRDMNRSTAQVAKALAEEQVYQPERDAFDACMNRHFLINQRIHFWRFRTNAPVQRIPNDLIMNAKRALDAGGITPNEARPIIADAFSVDLDHIDEDWAKVPPKLALTAARTGAMAGAEVTADGQGGEVTKKSLRGGFISLLRAAIQEELEEAKAEWLDEDVDDEDVDGGDE